MPLRWTASDVFAMSDLKGRLTEIERHALRGSPVILTRHGRPVFALVRLDQVGGAGAEHAGEAKPPTKLETGFYDEVFARGESDAASGNLTDWETIERRVEVALARRRRDRRTSARKTARASAAR